METNTKWDEKLASLGKQFVTDFFMLLKTSTLYDANNAAYQTALKTVIEDISKLTKDSGSLTLELIEENVYLNEEKVKSDIYTYASFSFLNEEFGKRELGGLRFETPPNSQELIGFIRVFNQNNVVGSDTFTQEIKKANVGNIVALENRRQLTTAVDEDTVITNKANAVRNYVRAVETVKEAVTQVKSNKGFDAGKAKRIVYNLVQHSSDEGYSFVSLSTIKNYDAYTFHHCVNVCIISIAFGQNLGLSKRQLADLGISALYHDLGKLQIPKEILNKTEKFTDTEWSMMKQHPTLAVKYLLPLEGATDLDVKKVVPAFEHHRDYDLTGYPPLTVRKPMNFFSKVVAIADAYDAMTSSRVYQKARLPSEALQIILKGAGKKFDPVLVKAFINTMGIFPVGSLVQLDNNYIGVVTEVNSDPKKTDRPKVSMMMDLEGNLRREKAIDLADTENQGINIVKAVDPDQYNINVAYYLLGV